MRRVNKKNTPPVRPVKKIELDDKNNKRKLILFILFFVIGMCAIGYGIYQAVSKSAGWTKIEANSASEGNCSGEFVFLYNLGVSGVSATVENKELVSIYTKATEEAYRLFHSDVAFSGVNNIYYINQHPNEEIVVDKVLYDAFLLLQRYDNRNIYLGPVYTQYDDMFFCEDDALIWDYDPIQNAEVAAYHNKIAAFAANKDAIDIQLLGNNTIKLYVSEEYLAYATENVITNFIDFFWMKNAFIIDYLAETLQSNHYTKGAISSYDGYSRNLDQSQEEFSFHIYDRKEQTIYQAATMKYHGTKNMVYLRDYMMNSQDIFHYYKLSNGEVRTSYLDTRDGLPRAATDSLVAYSNEQGCAEILLNVIPFYIADEIKNEVLMNLTEDGIYSVYSEDFVIYHNDTSLEMHQLYNNEEVAYSTKIMSN